jgi:carbonic anhydrase
MIDNDGLERVRAALSALKAVEMLCCGHEHLDGIEGVGLSYLVGLITEEFEGALDVQWAENRRASAVEKNLRQSLERLREPSRIRRSNHKTRQLVKETLARMEAERLAEEKAA